jgi:hypothetical protein
MRTLMTVLISSLFGCAFAQGSAWAHHHARPNAEQQHQLKRQIKHRLHNDTIYVEAREHGKDPHIDVQFRLERHEEPTATAKITAREHRHSEQRVVKAERYFKILERDGHFKAESQGDWPYHGEPVRDAQ